MLAILHRAALSLSIADSNVAIMELLCIGPQPLTILLSDPAAAAVHQAGKLQPDPDEGKHACHCSARAAAPHKLCGAILQGP